MSQQQRSDEHFRLARLFGGGLRLLLILLGLVAKEAVEAQAPGHENGLGRLLHEILETPLVRVGGQVVHRPVAVRVEHVLSLGRVLLRCLLVAILQGGHHLRHGMVLDQALHSRLGDDPASAFICTKVPLITFINIIT